MVSHVNEYFEVRIAGDGESDFFIASNEDEENYDSTDFVSAMHYARKVHGWVVKITEVTVYIAPGPI